MARTWQQTAALAGTSLGFGVVQLDVTVVNIAVAPIRDDLGGSVSAAQWVVNAYTLVFAALILSAGSLSDRVGAKRLLLTGFGLFTAASVACGLAPGLGWLVCFRAVQGVGAAALVPSSLSVLTHAYPDERERARAVGVWAAGASVGLAGGPLLGGVLIAASSWRLVFLVNLPLGLLGAWLVARHARETTRSRDVSFDPVGQLLGVAALGLLAAATVAGGARGFADPVVLLGYLGALVTGVVFVLVEARRPAALLPLRLFRSPTFSAVSAIGVTVNVAFYGLIFVLSLYFQQVRGLSPLQTGLAFLPTTGVVLAANLGAGRLVDRFGPRTVLSGSSLLLAVSLAGLLATGSRTPLVAVLPQLLLVGAALGLVVPTMTSALLSSVEASRSGVASGVLNTARQTGSVLGVALLGSFAAGSVVHGLRVSLGVGVGLALVTLVLSRLVGGATAGRRPARRPTARSRRRCRCRSDRRRS